MNPPAESKISWQAPEYIYKEKTADWYWIVSIITLSIAIISIILNNLIFAILIIVSSFTLSLFAGRKPGLISVEINRLGLSVGKTRYSYDALDSFWIETREIYPKIILKSKKTWMPYITVLIRETDSEQIRRKLLEHLPEEEHTEPFLEKLLIYFGF